MSNYVGEYRDGDGSYIKLHPSPTFKHPNAVVFLVNAPASVDLLEVVLVEVGNSKRAVEWLLKGGDENQVMGLDTEGYNRKVVLLQMSFQQKCVLIKFPKKKGNKKKEVDCEAIKKLLANKDLAKAGAELYGDALDLFLDWHIETNGLLDLTPLYQVDANLKLGLRNMFIKEYNCDWVKERKITLSNWALPQLSLAQIKYAALDAWVSYKIGVIVPATKRYKLTVHLSTLDEKLLMRLSIVGRQLRILKDFQKKKFIVPAKAQVCPSDSRLVLLQQERYEKRVRKGYAVTIKDSQGSDVKGVVTSVVGKSAVVKMPKKMDRFTPGINTNNYNERDRCIEEQEKTVNKIVKKGGIEPSSLLNLLLVTSSPIHLHNSSYDHFLIESLNPSQREAVAKAITNPISTIHGPPGTGKTTTIACISQCLTLIKKTKTKKYYKRKVLPSENHPYTTPVVVIAARQNVAALNVLHSLIKRNVQGVLLYVSEEYYIEWHEDNYESFKQKYVVVGNSVDSLSGWRIYNPGYEHPVIVVCTTGCLTASSQGILGVLPKKFDTLILDECSQMWVGEIMPILYQNLRIQRLVLVGDHKQLPPYGASEMRNASIDASSLFEFCLEDKRFASQMLSVQYRMPVPIGSFISSQFYDGKLASIHLNHVPPCVGLLTAKRVLWVDTCGMELKSIDTKSRYNLAEVDQVHRLVKYFTKHIKEAQRVVVITPYEEQRNRIENELKLIPGLTNLFKNQTIVYCVDSYQGREADIVILSLVSHNDRGSIGFIKEENRLNVMLSRVKLFMCIVGNYKTMLKSERAKQFSSLQDIGDYITAPELDYRLNGIYRSMQSADAEIARRMALLNLSCSTSIPSLALPRPLSLPHHLLLPCPLPPSPHALRPVISQAKQTHKKNYNPLKKKEKRKKKISGLSQPNAQAKTTKNKWQVKNKQYSPVTVVDDGQYE